MHWRCCKSPAGRTDFRRRVAAAQPMLPALSPAPTSAPQLSTARAILLLELGLVPPSVLLVFPPQLQRLLLRPEQVWALLARAQVRGSRPASLQSLALLRQ